MVTASYLEVWEEGLGSIPACPSLLCDLDKSGPLSGL